MIAPKSAASTEGNGNNAAPFWWAVRVQQVYASSEFSALAPGGEYITQLAFRPDAEFGLSFNTTLPAVRIDLSTTTATPDALGSIYANNVGADNTIVYGGSTGAALSLSSSCTGLTAGPKDFDIIIDLWTPFFYNPADGNLLIDVRNFVENKTTAFDFQDTSGDSVSRVSSSPGDLNSASATYVDTGGLVTKFTTSTKATGTDVSGTIVNQNWTSNNSPYRVVGDILVAGLTISPGVTILFTSNYTFEVAGKLRALGTEQQPISFRSTRAGWQGIYFNNAQAGSQVSYCSITGAVNSAIHLVATPGPQIANCSFIGNSTTDSGGAINAPAQEGDLVLDECTFTSNSSANHGGAVRAFMSSGVLRIINGCQFIGNIANPANANGDYVGGAIYVSGNAAISDTLFTNNMSFSRCSSSFGCTVTGRGGAIFIDSGGHSTVQNCIIVGNTVVGSNGGDCFFGGSSIAWGGAIFLNDGTLLIQNSILDHNVTSASNCGPSPYGAGLFVKSGSCNMVNVTCAYNTDTASGVNCDSAGTLGITNSIIFFNGGSQITGAATVTYSDVQGTTNYPGIGNISGNPIFLSTSDLIIVPGSPCIDKGSTNTVYNDVCFPPSLGNAPSSKVRNDMGAHGGPGASPRFLPRQEQPFKLDLFGCVPGYTYLIQAATDISASPSAWQTVMQVSNVHLGGIVHFREPSTNTLPQRFYKLILAQ